MTTGQKIRYYRKRMGLTQTELGEKLGVKTNAVSKWECGRVEDIPTSKIKALCVLFEIPNSYLIDDDPPTPENPPIKSNVVPSPQEGIKTAPPYTEEALKLAKDYDDLDGHGKKVVRLVADEEKARCTAPAPVEQPAAEKVIYIFPGYTSPMSAGTGQPAGDEYPENYRLVKEPPRRASFIAPVSGDSMEPTYSNGDLVFVRAQEEVEIGEIGVFWMDGQQWIKELGEGVLISHNPDPKYGPRPFTEDIRCQGLVLCVCDESYFG